MRNALFAVGHHLAGIGFDPVYTPRQFRRPVAEGAACGTATVVKGTEYFDARDRGFTMLAGEPFAAEREALGQLHCWLEAHADLYGGLPYRIVGSGDWTGGRTLLVPPGGEGESE